MICMFTIVSVIRLGKNKPGDYKESFNMTGASVVDNTIKWPDDLVPGFSSIAIQFMKDCKVLALRVLESMSYGLQLEVGGKQCHCTVWQG